MSRGGYLTKTDLKRYIGLKSEAEELNHQINRLEDDITTLRGIAIDGMPKSRNSGDCIGNMVIKLEELREQYYNKLNSALEELGKIEGVLDNLTEPIERRLIRKRYIEDKDWDDICEEMNYSWRQIHRIHSAVLIKISKMA